MTKTRAKNLLTRQQKLFRMPKLNLIDANAIDVEEAISRLFIFLRTGGRLIRRTDKPIFSGDGPDSETPAAVVNTVLDEAGEKFHGINNDQRRSLIISWFDSHFAMTSRRGKKAGDEYRMSGLRPLHYAIIKLFNPRVRSQDRYLSDFFYNAIRDDPGLTTNPDSLFQTFFGVGVQPHGDNDFRLNESELTALAHDGHLDVELAFLLRMVEPFPADKYSTKPEDQVLPVAFLCDEQIDLLRQDLKLLFIYRDHIPRRELISYMTTLMVFHAALYFFQVVRITNHIVDRHSSPSARGEAPRPGEARSHTPFVLDIFCDCANGHDRITDNLAKQSYLRHFKEVEQYFRSAYLLKKLDEFANQYMTGDQKKQSGRAYLELLVKGFMSHADINGYFARDIEQIRQAGLDEETEEYNREIETIIDTANRRSLNKLETFVEILCRCQYPTLREQHRKLLAGLGRIDHDAGFLAGKGRQKRKYVLGNELLEVLIQLAVLRQVTSDGSWGSKPIPITEFVDWLRGRYGILVDTTGPEVEENEEINRALSANLAALKTRLRQLGFFTDLADASNSQVITPRFPIRGARLAGQPATAA